MFICGIVNMLLIYDIMVAIIYNAWHILGFSNFITRATAGSAKKNRIFLIYQSDFLAIKVFIKVTVFISVTNSLHIHTSVDMM